MLSGVLALGGTAFLVGLTGAMSPGPYLTVTIAETMRRGRLAALSLLVGHATLEALLLVGFAFGLQAVLRHKTVVMVMGVVGGAVLLWMGGSLLIGAVRGTLHMDLEGEERAVMEGGTDAAEGARGDAGPVRHLAPVLKGALVSLSNPYWTLWWATIGVTLAIKGLQMGPMGVTAFFIGHELADLVWYGAVVMAVSSGRRLLEGTPYRVVMGACAVFLLYLGAAFACAGATGAVTL